MIGNLTRYFPKLKQICYKDHLGVVHFDNEKVALDNTFANGYVYYNGTVGVETRNGCIGEHDTVKPLVFVGAIPRGIPERVFDATISALSASNIEITDVSIDKSSIGEDEDIEIDKFVDCAMVRVEFIIESTEIYDPNCEIDICGS